MSSLSIRPRRRDASFLRMAAIAGAGGVLAIVFSIGFPLWAWHTGRPSNPVFSLFAAWGVLALCGAYGCIKTYLLSDRVGPRPPQGGIPLPKPVELHAAAAPPPRIDRRAA